MAKRSLVNRPGDQSETLYHGRPDHRSTNGCTLCHVHATSRVDSAPPLASPPGVACVFPSARARTLLRNLLLRFVVSRRWCMSYSHVRVFHVHALDRMYVRVCKRLPSLARSLARSSERRRCAREPRRRSALLFYSRISPLLHSFGRALRLRLSLLPSVRRVLSFSREKGRKKDRRKERERGGVREDNSNVPSVWQSSSSSPVSTLCSLPVLVRREHTRRERTSDVLRTPLRAYRAGLQRNAKESLTSTHS